MMKPQRIFQSITFIAGIVLVALLLTSMTGCQSSSVSDKPLLDTIHTRGKLVAGVKFDSKPFGYLDTDGKLKGYDIDLMREMGRRILGDPDAVEFQQVLASTRILAINSGSLDIVAATMTITPERENIIDFSDVYFEANQKVIVPLDSPVQALNELEAKTILYVNGTTGEKNIKEKMPNATHIGFQSTLDAFQALKEGKGDAMTTDDGILEGLIAESCQYRMLPERISHEPYGLGIKQDPDGKNTETFRTIVNKTLEGMRKDGTLDKIKQKWMKSAEAVCG